MLRLAFDFIIAWRETRTRPNAYLKLENIRLFADIIQPKKYQKGDIILNEGDICNCLFYIEKGFIRQHYLKHDKDVIEHLACEKDVVWCIDSYFNREPTHLMMDAVENSVLWEIPRDIMEGHSLNITKLAN